MKLDCVLTAVNENPLYINFIPFFVKIWHKLYPEVDVKIVLIANSIPDNLIDYKDNIILFKPLKNISTSFISQYIRLLYPSILDYKNGILITDIDIVPMNRIYYTKSIESFENNKFIYYRGNELFDCNQIAMCYNIATPKIWGEIFNIKSLENIKETLTKKYREIYYIEGHGNTGWSTDQISLYKYGYKWNKKTKNFICLKDHIKFRRLDRDTFNIKDIRLIYNIKNGCYIDYHCLRPFKKYEAINNKIYELL